MKVAVVYFSLEGNTKYVAEEIGKQIKADIFSLSPVKQYPTGKISKFIWGGKSAVFGEAPTLKAYHLDIESYDIIIIGTPVWAGTFAPPIRTFLKQNDLTQKKIGLYACNKGGGTESCFEKLQKELPVCDIIGKLSLIEPKVNRSENNNKLIKEFITKLRKE